MLYIVHCIETARVRVQNVIMRIIVYLYNLQYMYTTLATHHSLVCIIITILVKWLLGSQTDAFNLSHTQPNTTIDLVYFQLGQPRMHTLTTTNACNYAQLV